MPRAGDAFLNGALPVTHSPLDRVDFQALAGKFDIAAFVQQLEDLLTDYLFPIIKDLTGVDLTFLQPLLDELKAFMDGVSAALSGDPVAFFAALESFFGSDPTAFFTSFFNIFGGATNTAGVGTFINSLLGVFGGATTTAGASTFITNLLGAFGGASSPTGVNTFVTNLLGAFGGATTTSGAQSFITNLLGAFGGATTTTQANTFITNLLGAFGGSTTTGGVNTFVTNLLGVFGGATTTGGASTFITNLLGAFGGATTTTQASTFITNLLGAFGGATTTTGATSFINNFLGAFGGASTTTGVGTYVGGINTTASGAATNVASLITSLFGGSSILSQVQPGAVGGVTSGASLLTDVQTFLNNIFGGITKNTNTTTSQGDALDAVASQSNTVISTSATMEQILAALGSGTPDSDDFERTSSSNLGANWNIQQTGTGTLATPNGHDASSTGTGSSYEFTARKTDKVASTNHQVSTIVLASAFPSYPFFTPLPYGGYIDVWVRMSAFTTFATRTGLRFRINGNPPYQATWTIDWVSSGTVTNLASGTLAAIPGAGASIAFEVGVGGNTLAYQARVNGSPVADFTDSTNKGLGNTGRGFGGKGNSGIGTAQGVPKLQQWTAQG